MLKLHKYFGRNRGQQVDFCGEYEFVRFNDCRPLLLLKFKG
jgi:hypothetical protein